MKIQLLSIFFLLISLNAFAQDELKVFESFEDYQNDTGISYTGNISYWGFLNLFDNRRITFKKGKNREETIHVDCYDNWGFSLNQVLFQMVASPKVKSHPMCVIAQDDLVYFENGIGHLKAMESQKKMGKYIGQFPTGGEWGVAAAVSPGLNYELISLKRSDISNMRLLKRFREANPQYSEFFECIKWNSSLKKIRACYFNFFSKSTPVRGTY